MIGIWIVGCEIAFWVLVLAGLSVRYLAGWKKGGAALLLMTPVVDLLLITLTIMDLRGGAEAEFMHGLAAVYIGVTIAFGHRMIHWADERFAYRFGGGAKPHKAPKYGKAHARRERQGWFRHALAWVIGSILIFLMIVVVNDPDRTEALKRVPLLWACIVGIDFVISFSYTLWPRKGKGY